MIKVTFERNVWKRIVGKELARDEPTVLLRSAIRVGTVRGYIPEVAFTFEGLERKLRQSLVSTYEAKIDCAMDMNRRDGRIGLDFCIGQNLEAYPVDAPHLLRELQSVRAWGLKLLRCVRVAKIANPAIQECDYIRPAKAESLETIYRFADCATTIENLGGGMFHIKQLGERYSANWRVGIAYASATAAKKAVAEWADGDSVAAHFAYRNDYFCTDDNAKSAGPSSVLSPTKRLILEKRFGIAFVTPEELCSIIG